jgi:catechol 2,3-dioxygenase-like lactoylglutathione lyase family enzyme
LATAKTAHLSHIGLPVTDLAKSVAFYEKWAGMKVQGKLDDPMGVRSTRLAQKAGEFVLSLLVGPMSMPMPGVMHLGFDCASKAEVDKIAADAKKAGILTFGPADGGGGLGYQAFISDPDGNALEFAFGQKVGLTEE